MSAIRRASVLFLSLCLLFPLLVTSASAKESTPTLSAHAACLVEADSGEILMGHNAHLPMGMASTTKLMTALCALSLAAPGTPITVAPEAVGVEGSSVYLAQGEVLTVEELLYALLLESANDAALSLAIGTAGSEAAFVDKMNLLATQMGLEATRFQNPHGLYHPDHFTTAYDLCKIMLAVLEDPLLSAIVSAKKATIPGVDGGRRHLSNHNRLLSMYEGCVGGKTGYTTRTGRCLVSAARRDGVLLVAVTLCDGNDWRDHAAMLDYGFSRYVSRLLCRAEEYLIPIPVVGGAETYVTVSNTQALQHTLPRDHAPIQVQIHAPRFLYAGVRAGRQVGYAVFYITDDNGRPQELGRVPLTAKYTVPTAPRKSFWQWLRGLFGKI